MGAPVRMAEDVRRRRAERVKQQRLKTALPKYGRYALIAVVVILAVGAAMVLYKPASPLKFGHEHPSFSLFIGGQEVSFNSVDYDIANIKNHVHMHTAAGDPVRAHTWHLESNFPNGIPDLTLQHIFAQYGVTFSQGYLKLDTHDEHNGSEFRDTGSTVWHVFLSKNIANSTGNQRQAFEPVPGDYSQAIPRDGDKFLITYGDLTPEEITREEGLVPDPQP
jgi:hypothetical protein